MTGIGRHEGRVGTGTRWSAGTFALASMLLPSLGRSLSRAAEPDRPATAPATRPATEPAGELDWKKAAATIDALGGVWLSIHEAVEKNDLDTAAELTGDLIKEAETFRDRTRGTILAVPVNVATGQLNRLHSAMKEKNVEKVRTIMEGIDRIGHSIAEIVRGRNEDQAPPKE